MPCWEDGKLPLPLIDPLPWRTDGTREAQRSGAESVSRTRDHFATRASRACDTHSSRQVRVLVIREDSPSERNYKPNIHSTIQGIYGNPVTRTVDVDRVK